MKIKLLSFFILLSTFTIEAMPKADPCLDVAIKEYETYLDRGGNPELAVEWLNAAYAGCYCQSNPCP